MPPGKDASKVPLGTKSVQHGSCKQTCTSQSANGGLVLLPQQLACGNRCICLHSRLDACCHQKNCANAAKPLLREYAPIAASDQETHCTPRFTCRFWTLPMILSRFCATSSSCCKCSSGSGFGRNFTVLTKPSEKWSPMIRAASIS